jgi:tRNA(Arg) A34 adenosine deaminase TadA
MAEARLQTHSLGAAGVPPHELVSSCEPCAMCLGATLWSGVRRLVAGATKADAESIGYDEGPVFPESYAYLERKGVEVVRGVRRDAARALFAAYAAAGGEIY